MRKKKKFYDAKKAEKKWQSFWEKNEIYSFDQKNENIFSINTPPPYPSGEFHIGNILNWTYFDIVARFKRMKGFNVHFPQGWDVHGLPTESRVEQWKGKKSSEVERSEWIAWCNEWTSKYIKEMKKMMKILGYSFDWSLEYKTSDKEYIKMVQLSFLEHLEKGLAYRGKHPVNWCTNCRTAIADAEVEYRKRSAKLYHIKFSLVGEGEIVIATTRPEFLSACVAVAVHPEDERYKEIVGRYAIVPLFRQEVEIFADESVDPEFGSGIVMVCTFGDKRDVEFIFRHNLPIIEAIDEKGIMTKSAGKYHGLEIDYARKMIIKDLGEENLVLKEESIKQNVGVCWRCKTPIEILNKEQWFLRATQFNNRVIEETKKVKWFPEHMALRQIQWAQSMKWDWVISRQKVFGTPIPIWYCKCGEIIPAEKNELPVDPVIEIKNCPRCNSLAKGETDRFDTWMDSSLSNYWHAGWLKTSHPSHKKLKNHWEKMIPCDLQPNGTDIIRTWDYYLMLRSIMLTGKPAYKNVLINGMVLGEDGRKMSKSLGNFVTASEILKETYSDALRYWATKGATGSDLPFSRREIKHGERFFTKVYNIFQFVKMHGHYDEYYDDVKNLVKKLGIVDKWIITKLQRLIGLVTEDLENYKFNEAMLKIENFIWHEFADFYIEMVKHRLYNDKKNDKKESSQLTLYYVLLNSLKLLAPFAPFITEDIYQNFFKKNEKSKSIHVSKWPILNKDLIFNEEEKLGEMAKDVISSIRQYKTSKRLSMNATLEEVVIENKEISPIIDDIKETMKIKNVKIGKAHDIVTKTFKIGLRIKD